MNEKAPPWIQIVQLDEPSLNDNTADAERLLQALKSRLNTAAVDIDLTVLKTLPKILRDHDFNICCVLFKEKNQWVLVDIQVTRDMQICAGLAVDLGTTRVMLRLVDLASGRPMADSAFDNPQETIGPDVLSRIHFAENENGLGHLNDLIISGLNSAIAQLCYSQQLTPEHIFAITVAGNTTMTHLFMGLTPRWIIREPYIPVTNNPGVIKAAALGLRVNPRARALIFPNIGSYFGGDLVAGALFSGIYRNRKTSILVDVGTNAEVLLGNENWLIACAGAAGPALEGGVTRMGMPAGPGVIDQI
ncbi:MAG: ASKHA domain-containing protein, partial [Desulfobacterales bacterium]